MGIDKITKDDGTLDDDAVNSMIDEYDRKQLENTIGEGDDSKQSDPPKDEHDGADDDSGADDAAAEDSGDDDAHWTANIEGDLRELIESLGLSDEEVRQFDGPEELHRYAMLLDKHLSKLGKDRQGGERRNTEGGNSEGSQDRDVSGESGKSDDSHGQSEDGEQGYKPQLSEEEYDQVVIDEFQHLANHFNGRIQQLEEQLQVAHARSMEAEAAQREQLIDSLDQPELFGSPDSRTSEQQENLQKLSDAFEVLRAGKAALGESIVPNRAWFQRALQLEFADQLQLQHRQKFNRAARQQSKRTLGGGGNRAARGKNAEWTGDPTRDPELISYYKQLESEGA